VLDHAAAYKLAVQLEPKAIIPMHYGELGGKDALKAFLKEAGSEDVKPIDKLTAKRKDLEGKEGEIIVLAV
jgi:L-ascorbate metabolism protein UlaG (beta-lactamase superfamily)